MKSYLKPLGQEFEKLSINSFRVNKSNLLIKIHFLLKSGSQVIVFLILLKVGYLVTIVVNLVYKWKRQIFSVYYKKMSDCFLFSEYVEMISWTGKWKLK